MEQGLIVLMRTLSSDIFNLLNATRAMVNEVRWTLLLNGYLVPRNREQFVTESEKFIDTKLGITDNVIEASRELFLKVKNCKYAGNDKAGYEKDFKTILEAYKPYMKQHNPRPMLNYIAQLLTAEIGTLSISAKFVMDNETKINSFTAKLSKVMAKRKKDKEGLNPESPADKDKLQEIDKSVL